MADYSGINSRSQAPTSDHDSPENTLLRIPKVSAVDDGSVGGPSKSITPTYHHYHQQHLIAPSLSEPPARKPRGRPPGSKNKPKPPLVITRDSGSVMKTAILEISAGCDIIDTITSFARRNHVGVTIISATGSVSNVTLRNPVFHEPPLSLHRPFDLLSLTGSFIASVPALSSNRTPQSSLSCSFGVTLAGNEGQVFGGTVAGKVMVETKVTVVTITFVNPSFHRLPCEAVDNEDRRQEARPGSSLGNNGGGGVGFVGGASATESSSFPGVSVADYGVSVPAPLNYQPSPDVMTWGPPPPRPY